MPNPPSRTNKFPVLLQETLSQRKLPVNFNRDDLAIFDHELQRRIPQTILLEFTDVNVSADGFLFKGNRILPQSFAFPVNLKRWKRRSVVKFFANNLLRHKRLVDEDVLWVTDDWSKGYFHWLTDVLPRLFVMRSRLEGLALFLPATYQSLDFVNASLKAFGMQAQFIGANEVLKCRRVLLPTHTAPSGHYNEETIQGVRSVLLEAYADASPSGTGERIYLSRGRADKRRIANEAEVIDALASFGFQTIYGEDLSLAQQIKIFSRARYFVSNHGAGLTNMLFMPADASVLELRHHTDCVNNCYFTLSSALNLNYYYQTCTSSNSNEDPHTAHLLVDIETLQTNLNLLLSPKS